jgi:Flp pilus assembly pilin Flp
MWKGTLRLAGRLWRDDQGQDLAEYGIALAVIAAVIGLTAVFIGMLTSDLWQAGQDNINSAVAGS